MSVLMQVSAGTERSYVASPRVQQMILYLLRREEELGQIERGQVTFHFAGEKSLTAEVLSCETVSIKGRG